MVNTIDRSAIRALPAWRGKLASERAAVLKRFHDLMQENKEDLAQLITAENGKPLGTMPLPLPASFRIRRCVSNRPLSLGVSSV